MSDLAPFVAAAIRDKVVEDLNEELKTANAKIEKFRSWIPSVDVEVYSYDNGNGVEDRRVDFSSSRRVYLTTGGGGGYDTGRYIYFDRINVDHMPDLRFEVLNRMNFRFGNFFDTADGGGGGGEFKFQCQLVGVGSRVGGDGDLVFKLKFSRQYCEEEDGRSDDGTITYFGYDSSSEAKIYISGVFYIPIDQYSVLSGLSIEHIRSLYSLDEINIDRTWFQVDTDVLERVVAGTASNVRFHLNYIRIPFSFIKKKCHLL